MKNSMTKGFFILSVAGVLSKLLSLIYVPFLVKFLGDEGYGIFAVASQVYVLIYVVTNSGIPTSISKIISEFIAIRNYIDAIKIFKISRLFLTLLGTAMCVLTYFCSDIIAVWMGVEKAGLAIKFLATSLIFTSLASSYRGYFQGKQNMTPTAISQVVEQIAYTIAAIFFVSFFINRQKPPEWVAAGATLGTPIGAFFSVLVLLFIYKKENCDIKSLQDENAPTSEYKSLVKKILIYSLPITICSTIQNLGTIIDTAILNNRLILMSGITEVMATENSGYYNKYQQLLSVVITLMVALQASIIPSISNSYAAKNISEVNNKVSLAFKLCFLITIPSAFGFSCLSHQIFDFLHYGEGAYLMRYGSFLLIFFTIVQIQTAILQGIGKLYYVMFHIVITLIVKSIANYYLTPILGLYGIIIGTAVGYFVSIFMNQLLIKKTLNLEENPFKHILKPILASISMTIGVLAIYSLFYVTLNKFFINYNMINTISVLAAILFGALSYFYIGIRIKLITQNEIDSLPKKIKALIPKKWQTTQ